MWDDDSGHTVLVSQVVIELLKVSLPVTLLSHLLGFIVEVQGSGASLKLSQELLPASQEYYLNSRGMWRPSVARPPWLLLAGVVLVGAPLVLVDVAFGPPLFIQKLMII